MFGNIVTYMIFFFVWRFFRLKDAENHTGAFADPAKAPGVASTAIAFLIGCAGLWVAVFAPIYLMIATHNILVGPLLAFPAMYAVFQATRKMPRLTARGDAFVEEIRQGKQPLLGSGTKNELVVSRKEKGIQR